MLWKQSGLGSVTKTKAEDVPCWIWLQDTHYPIFHGGQELVPLLTTAPLQRDPKCDALGGVVVTLAWLLPSAQRLLPGRTTESCAQLE